MDDHKLFVGNMAARISQRDLWRYFSTFGPIDECAKFHESYAFVRFVYADDAHRAREQTHGALLKGRKLKVEFAANNQKLNVHQRIFQEFSEYFYVQPLRRTSNSTTKTKDKEFFSTEHFLRLAGINDSSPDESFDLHFSSKSHPTADSKYFPRISMNSTFQIDRNDSPKNETISFDFSRMRLFSDVSSGFGDDSNLFID